MSKREPSSADNVAASLNIWKSGSQSPDLPSFLPPAMPLKSMALLQCIRQASRALCCSIHSGKTPRDCILGPEIQVLASLRQLLKPYLWPLLPRPISLLVFHKSMSEKNKMARSCHSWESCLPRWNYANYFNLFLNVVRKIKVPSWYLQRKLCCSDSVGFLQQEVIDQIKLTAELWGNSQINSHLKVWYQTSYLCCTLPLLHWSWTSISIKIPG